MDPDVDAAILVPQVARAVNDLRTLARLKPVGLIASLAGQGDPSGILAALKSQLGFDPGTPEGLATAGLKPEATLLVALEPRGRQVAVIAVADGAKFSQALARIAGDRLGARDHFEKDGATAFRASPTAPPILAYAMVDRWAVFSAGSACVEVVAEAIARGPNQGLAASLEFEGLARESATRDVAVYVPRTSPLVGRADLGAGMKASAVLEPHQLRVVADLPLTTAGATALGSMRGGVGSPLLGRLDPNAVVVLRSGIDPGTAWPVVNAAAPEWLRRELLAMGLQINEMLLNLEAGEAVSVALTNAADLTRISLDPRDSNPFSLVTLSGVGRVKDPVAAHRDLDAVQKFGGRFGMQVEHRDAGAADVYVFNYSQGEGASVALAGQEVLVSGGSGHLDQMLSRTRGGTAGFDAGASPGQGLQQAGTALWLDMAGLARQVRAIPSSAFGLGGFAIRAAVQRWVDAFAEIQGVLATADYSASANGGQLHVEVLALLP